MIFLYKIEGIGFVKIYIFEEVIRTLTNVRFIPNMRKNLISLGMLDTKELTWSASEGLLQVKKGDVIFIRSHKH
jgi:hypothetical protein